MAKVGTSNPDRTISLKRLQCVVENKHIHLSQAKYQVRNSDPLHELDYIHIPGL